MVNDINELVPAMRPLVNKLITEGKKIGLDLRIVETYRTSERQAQLYAQGRTKPGPIVTNAKPGQSLHEQRRAVDLVDRKKGYDIKWETVGQIATQAGLVWGGTFGDKPHFEYHGPAEVKQEGEQVTQEQKDFEKLYGLWQAGTGKYPHELGIDAAKELNHIGGIRTALMNSGKSFPEADSGQWRQYYLERIQDGSFKN